MLTWYFFDCTGLWIGLVRACCADYFVDSLLLELGFSECIVAYIYEVSIKCKLRKAIGIYEEVHIP